MQINEKRQWANGNWPVIDYYAILDENIKISSWNFSYRLKLNKISIM